MELWEFFACLKAYNEKRKAEAEEKIALCWQTANFVGAAFGGKLKKLNYYLKDNKPTEAPTITKEEFEEKLRKSREGK